jgi:hypothetical protein
MEDEMIANLGPRKVMCMCGELHCKVKTREAAARHEARHPGSGLAANKKWREKNRDKIRERDLKRYAADPDGAKRRSRAWRERSPEKAAEHHRTWREAGIRWHYRTLYGLEVGDKESILKAQVGLCAICHTDTPKGKGWHVDHCHDSKVVRGVLCHHCNLMLGHARDSIDTLRTAINYLEKSR